MSKEKTYSQDVKNAYDRMVEAYTCVELDKVTILTGSNGSGKSMIRKQLPFLMRDKLGLESHKDTRGMITSTSMDARTGSNPEWGGLSGIMRDTEWIATSQDTLHSLDGLFKTTMKSDKCKYIVIDEFEIGCGEETVLALCHFINKNVKELLDAGKIEGAMIITHSRLGVEHIDHDRFINIDGMGEDEWLEREIVPTDLDKLDKNELFLFIRDNQK